MEIGTIIVVKISVTFANGTKESFHMFESLALEAQNEFDYGVCKFIKLSHFETGSSPIGTYSIFGDNTVVIKASAIDMISIVHLAEPMYIFHKTDDGEKYDIICTHSAAKEFHIL
jgi:hypothetical protein